jgi:hypothetical protein
MVSPPIATQRPVTPVAPQRTTLPQFVTKVTRKPKYTPLNVTNTTLDYQPNQEMIDILTEIDPDKLIVGRKGARQSVYSLDELRGYARRLNIKVSGSKQELIDRIKSKMVEGGLA